MEICICCGKKIREIDDDQQCRMAPDGELVFFHKLCEKSYPIGEIEDALDPGDRSQAFRND